MNHGPRSRRQYLGLLSGGGILGTAGCLRLSESADSSPESNGQPSEDFDIQFVPAWEMDEHFFRMDTADDDFFLGTLDKFIRRRPNGEIVFDSEVFHDEYFPTLRAGYQSAICADASGVYVGGARENDQDGGRVYAIEPETGEQRWMHEEPADGLHNEINAIHQTDGLVIAASMSSGSGSDQEPTVRAFDAETGEQQWEVNYSEAFITQIFSVGTQVVVQRTRDYMIHELQTGDHVGEIGIDSGFRRAQQVDDVLYIPNGRLTAYSIADGQQLWSQDGEQAVNTSVGIGSVGVFAGTEDGFVFGYDLETGDQLWENRTEGAIEHQPVVADGVVWVATQRGDLSGYDEETGALVYSEQITPDFHFLISNSIFIDSYHERSQAYEIQGV